MLSEQIEQKMLVKGIWNYEQLLMVTCNEKRCFRRKVINFPFFWTRLQSRHPPEVMSKWFPDPSLIIQGNELESMRIEDCG